MRQPFILYRRGKTYYASFWDSTQERYSSRRSCSMLKRDLLGEADHLSPTSKAGSRAIVEIWLKLGVKKDGSRLAEYLQSFWKEESDYVQGVRQRGRTMSANYLDGNQSAIKRVLVFMNQSKQARLQIRAVTPAFLESLVRFLRDSGELGNRRINGILQAVTVALSEAHRLGLIRENPSLKIKALPEDKTEREPLTPDEVRKLFCADWTDSRHRTINLLSATTGMRLGECRGLKIENVHDDWIGVRHNWQDGEGLKMPKGNKARAVPCPLGTIWALRETAKQNPWGDGFIFAGTQRGSPIGKESVARTLKNMLALIGISEAEIKRRKLTFHAWRHWYNSMLRGRVPDHALRRLTGHSSEAMTERYTAITEEQRKAVVELAEGLV